jgi:hypothetical protein
MGRLPTQGEIGIRTAHSAERAQHSEGKCAPIPAQSAHGFRRKVRSVPEDARGCVTGCGTGCCDLTSLVFARSNVGWVGPPFGGSRAKPFRFTPVVAMVAMVAHRTGFILSESAFCRESAAQRGGPSPRLRPDRPGPVQLTRASRSEQRLSRASIRSVNASPRSPSRQMSVLSSK